MFFTKKNVDTLILLIILFNFVTKCTFVHIHNNDYDEEEEDGLDE